MEARPPSSRGASNPTRQRTTQRYPRSSFMSGTPDSQVTEPRLDSVERRTNSPGRRLDKKPSKEPNEESKPHKSYQTRNESQALDIQAGPYEPAMDCESLCCTPETNTIV